ncbi:hypothetical protein M8Z33_10500 [Streptomyces sp. ZAF1911]|uniref:hypothetical protein n=1 Tax=Streptomyces sp. ZAF1911 TaxID=2944129 RepID=UPI00237A2549|nr:hypothetical protein [Streptomyces sp. ZAF1911]MDD9377093.1 hypothetical protein [Streptomyces sp. ZAF1911]
MNSFKRTMTAVGTAVVIAAVGALAAPAASAAVPAARQAALAADPEAKSAAIALPAAWVRQNQNNQFIVFVDAKASAPSRVEVRLAGTDKVVAVVDQLTYVDMGPSESGGPVVDWYEGDKQPLVLADVGDYELDVYAKDGTTEVSRRNAGRFTHAIDARIEAKSSRQEFSLDALDTQVTGTVTAVHPRTGERLPMTSAKIAARLGDGRADGWSDAQGKFTITVAALGTEKTLTHTVALASGGTEVPVTTPATIRAQKSTLTLTPTAPLTARYGTAVPVRGSLTRLADDGTVKPAAGRNVAASGAGKATASTGPDGSYTLLPPLLRTGSLGVSVQDAWLLGDGTRTATVAKVTHTTKVMEEKLVATDKYGGLTFSGKVTVDGITSQQAPIQIQFQYYPGKWVTRQSFTVPYNKTFTVKVTQPSSQYPSDGWRVYTPGTSNIGPSTGTQVLRQTRAATQITDERSGSSYVTKGEQLSVSAVLKTSTPGGFVPYPGQKVRYYFRPSPDSAWKEMGTSVSGADGAVSKKFTAQTSGYWRIRFVDADANHLVSRGPERRVRVTR